MTKAKGSSTCVMASLSDSNPNLMETCNLGDSAYLLVRPVDDHGQLNIKKVFRSKT